MEKKYLKISNDLEIDIKSFELIGASTKRDDPTKIGQFGSGLNYSIAWLLRNNVNFKVFSGDNEIKFTTNVVDLRGQVFQRIYINGKKTSFTTEMGHKWEAWYVVREIYCNALDEINSSMKIVNESELFAVTEKTCIYIEMVASIQEVVDNWDLYFSIKRTDMIEDFESGCQIYPGGEDLIVYRKGIRCHFEKGVKSQFHYNMPELQINENREVKDLWELKWELTTFWMQFASVDLIKRLQRKMNKSYEANLLWDTQDYRMSINWQEAIGTRTVVEYEMEGHYQELSEKNNPLVLPRALVDTVLNKFVGVDHVAGKLGKRGIREIESNEKQKYLLKKALDWFKETEYEMSYPIFIAEFNRKGVRGQAHENKIYVCEEAFESLYTLVKILIEENEHLKTGYEDCSRSFQDHFIRMFLDEKSNRFAIVL